MSNRSRSAVARVVVLVVGLVSFSTSAAANDEPPPEVRVNPAAGVRYINSDGRFSLLIPFSSRERNAMVGTGSPPSCDFVTTRRTQLSSGRVVERGTRVVSRWVYREATPQFFEAYDSSTGTGGGYVDGSTRRVRLAEMLRLVVASCDVHATNRDSPTYRWHVYVPPTDPTLSLDVVSRRGMSELVGQLPRSRSVADPVVDQWGGLVTRAPAWFAIEAAQWREVRSNERDHLGFLIQIVATPIALDFELVWDDADTAAVGDLAGTLSCIDHIDTPIADSAAMPARPVLPDLSFPGVQQSCTWAPHGPGAVTSTPFVTYRIDRQITWRGTRSFEEWLPESPFRFRGTSTTWPTGEIRAVNVVP
jgi:hypothetical protein